MPKPGTRERAYLVGWESSRRAARDAAGSVDGEDSLDELAELAASAGAAVSGRTLQRSPAPDPATLVGRGKLDEIRAFAHAAEAGAVIFDNDLTPTQLRNLEHALDLKVIDRTQMILDIFARRARTREGQLQVELAQLNYLLPRLAGSGTALSRLGGGIGTRGPGEQQLEFDRRRIRARIRKLREGIEHVRSGRALHRARREEQGFMSAALVGYTNAGKSTLFNALTRSEVLASARAFATLDPTVRRLALPSRRPTLLSDTVGFIRRLPPHLIAAFRATLEELGDADLLLHVTDASDAQHASQDAAVIAILESLDVASVPRLHVWNKADLLDTGRAARPGGENEATVSALTGEGLDDLRRMIDVRLGGEAIEAEFEFAASDGEAIARLHRLATVLSQDIKDDRVRMRARIAPSVQEEFQANLRLSLSPSRSAKLAGPRGLEPVEKSVDKS